MRNMYLTLPRLIVTVLFMFVSFIMTVLMMDKWGYGYIGGIIGFLLGLLVSYILFTVVVWLWRLLFLTLPSCKRGQCKSYKDYIWPKGTFFGRTRWGVYHCKCNCGDYYVRDGKRFMEVVSFPDGPLRPYKKLIGFRKWTDDSDATTIPPSSSSGKEHC